MAPRRSENERTAILNMYKQGNSYGELSVVLGIFQSTCCHIVRRFCERGSLKDIISPSRPRILDDRGDHDIGRRLNDPNTSTMANVSFLTVKHLP